ncbi:MAG: serine/threonine protein kinase [Pirellula sp.]
MSDPLNLEEDQLDHLKCLELLDKIYVATDTTQANSQPGLIRFQNPVLAGIGAFGVIYSAYDRQAKPSENDLYPKVAVKFLRPSKRDNEVARKRFDSEARTCKSLSHPNIIPINQSGQVEKYPYIVEEFADHGSLADYLEQQRLPMSARQTAWLVMKIAEALHVAHSSTVIHRDIKPGNILIRKAGPEESSEGLGLWPLLTDFGLAKDISTEFVRSSWTRTGEVLGTVRYMSPEQILGKSLITQTDLFSLGIVFHELLSGENPFLAANDFETQENIVKNPPRPLSKRARIPQALQAILQRCLEKDPSQRYPSASELVTDLRNFLDGKPVAVESPSAWSLLVRLVRLRPIMSAVLSTIFFWSLVTVALLNQQWKTQRELAKQRQEINQLFLQSIDVSNSRINDAVIAGARISQSDLLENLLKQIPLLQEALSLNPEDQKLAVHLQIMHHYAALCYHQISEQSSGAERQEKQSQGIEQRHRSLDLIERLLQNCPMEDPNVLQRRLRNRIVGEHWMAMAYTMEHQQSQRLEWIERSIEHALSYLKEYPEDRSVESLLQSNRTLKAVLLRKQEPKAAIEALESVFQYYDSMRNGSVLDLDSTSHAMAALCGIVQTQIENGDRSEIDSGLDECLNFCQREVYPRSSENWSYRDLWLSTLSELCRDLYQAKQWSALERVSKLWRSSVESLPNWSDASEVNGMQQCRSSSLAMALIFESLVQEKLGQIEASREVQVRLAQVWQECNQDQAFRPEAFVDFMMKMSISEEDRKRLLGR